MLARNKIERNALALAAAEEDKRQHAAWAAATASRSWYVTRIYGPGVKRTRDTLKRYGFESWYPIILKSHPVPRSRLSRKQRLSAFNFMEFRPEPFLRNYLLVEMDLRADHWHAAFRDAGAWGIACEGDVPFQIAPADIERLRAFENGDGHIPGEIKVKQMFNIGDAVQMVSGPFAGFTGSVDQVDEEGRLGLVLNIFGRPTPFVPEFSDFVKA